jgi:hypothetical protein
MIFLKKYIVEWLNLRAKNWTQNRRLIHVIWSNLRRLKVQGHKKS